MRRNQAMDEDFRLNTLRSQALARLERAHGLHQRFFERAADRHGFADRLHLRTKTLIRAREFLELPFRNFDDHVIERWLEAGGRLQSDLVFQFVERVTDSKL